MRDIRGFRVLLITAALLIGLVVPPAASAATDVGGGGGGGYSGVAAAAWADNHYDVCGSGNNNWPCFSGSLLVHSNDCTNFVSIAMYKGGRSFYTQNSDVSDPDNWLAVFNPSVDWWRDPRDPARWYWSTSWARVGDLRRHLLRSGGVLGSIRRGDSIAADSGGRTGDILFYDWSGDGSWNHVAMVVASGAPTTGGPRVGSAGDLIDQHESDRFHEWWTGAQFSDTFRFNLIQAIQVNG